MLYAMALTLAASAAQSSTPSPSTPQAPIPTAKAADLGVASQAEPSGRVAVMVELEWQKRLRNNPLFASSFGNHEFDDQLPDVSPEALQERVAYDANYIRVLEGLDTAALSPDDQVTQLMLIEQLKNRARSLEFFEYQTPLNADSGFHTSFARLPDRTRLKSELDVRNYLRRMRAFPAYMGQQIENMRAGIDSGRAGTYWVNTYDLASRPLYARPALSMHEAVPGHHLQIALNAELDHLPPFRHSASVTAFSEGWALYTEWLGVEMGIYTDPYEEFGRLTYEMWCAARLVVDTGLHAFGWTREQAIDYLASNTALSIHECTTEVDRYISWPGQALAYKTGELEIRALRAEAEARLGAGFDLKAFHDQILGSGSVPLRVSRAQTAH